MVGHYVTCKAISIVKVSLISTELKSRVQRPTLLRAFTLLLLLLCPVNSTWQSIAQILLQNSRQVIPAERVGGPQAVGAFTQVQPRPHTPFPPLSSLSLFNLAKALASSQGSHFQGNCLKSGNRGPFEVILKVWAVLRLYEQYCKMPM